MERSEILEALSVLHKFIYSEDGVDDQELEDALDTLNAAHDFDPRENWWDQV